MKGMREEFAGRVAKLTRSYPHWRYGQTVFNLAYALYPDRADQLRGGPLDPFYRDERAGAFIDAIFDGVS